MSKKKITNYENIKNMSVDEMSEALMHIICGAEIIGHSAQAVAGESALIKLWTPGEYRAGPGQRMDLCLNCYEKFIQFVESGE